MPPRLNILSGLRALSVQPKPLAQWPQQACLAAQTRRLTTNRYDSSESEQGFSDVLRAKMEAFGQAPKKSEEPKEPVLTENQKALRQLQMAAYGLETFDPEVHGHKFGVPVLPIAPDMNHKRRYDTVVDQMTKLLMRDGKLAKAQRDMAMVLNYLRSSPAPKLNPAKPVMPGSPPPSELPLDPVTYLTVAIDSVAPLVRIQKFAGLAGGGRALEVPCPLRQRQRRRTAFGWILDVVNKKGSRGSGRAMFPNRVAEEIVAVMEGRSSVWDKRHELHKRCTAVRSNVNSPKLGGREIPI